MATSHPEVPDAPDDRGVLTVAEKELPFVPVRAFWITDADGQTRGGHGHKRTHMVLVAIAGSIRVSVHSAWAAEFQLQSPGEGLHLEPEDWHVLDYSPGAACWPWLRMVSTPTTTS